MAWPWIWRRICFLQTHRTNRYDAWENECLWNQNRSSTWWCRCLIITTAVDNAPTNQQLLLEILQMYWCFFAIMSTLTNHTIYFTPEPKQTTNATVKIWDINRTKETMGKYFRMQCDISWVFFGIGKGVSLKNFRTDKNFHKSAYVFNRDTCTKQKTCKQENRHLLVCTMVKHAKQ